MNKPSHITALILLTLLSITLSAKPNKQKLAMENQHQHLEELASDREWLDLLHYHKIGLFSVFESQADDSAFFFAMTGKKDPKAELKATFNALTHSDYSPNSAICRFPARLHWLQTKGFLGSKNADNCSKYKDWFNKIDAKSLTLAFPAAYLNSPSSMYGHTFIRINRKTGSNPLLDYSINYAANADPDDNELVFSYKGLSGGYPGVFSVLPYYQKVTEYSFLEARDVWEYELNLTEAEVEQFIRHTWEIQNTHFDYYFFNENCSYHLLTLLDAASERFNLSKQFLVSAIPADTVREARKAGLISKAHFRPSTMSLMSHMLNQSSDTIKKTAKMLVESDVEIEPLASSLSNTEQAKTLELAYQYSRYLSVRKKQDQKKQAKRAISILSARSKINDTKVFSDYPTPKYRDDEGHNSKRLEVSLGQENEQNFTQVGMRMAYHDRLDNLPGYLQGAQLEMFHAKIRHTELKNGKDSTRLEELKLIDIASYSPRNDFVTPLSWEVSTGLKRPDAQPEELAAFLSAGWGGSYLFGKQQFYGLTFFDLNVDDDIAKGHHFSMGPKIGWLSQHESWSINLELKQNFDISGADYKARSIELGFSKSLAKHWQLRLNGQYLSHAEISKTDYSKSFSLSLMHYF
tara:strand:- start:33439 stop:35340 length:1902 start_codon:yes stop_codon:yes gene_type:complete